MMLTEARNQRPALPNSEALYRRARRVSPGGVHGDGRFAHPFPVYFRSARGGHITDVDGTEYVDLHCGFGAIILGHAQREWLTRTMLLAASGTCLAAANELEVELAEVMVAAIPGMDRVALCSTGSEATLHALRLARAATGRRVVVKFEGNYHGWHDYVAWSTHFDPSAVGGTAAEPCPVPASEGMSPGAGDEVITCGYNDVDRLERIFHEHGSRIAALIVEPVFHNAGVIVPTEPFLAACQRLCHASGAVLVADEVITGVRHGIGGVSARLGLRPDIVTMAKALGNGVPIGLVAMTAPLAEHLRPLGGVLYAGTFNGNQLSVAAALSCVDMLSSRPETYAVLESTASRLERGMSAILVEAGADARFVRYGSVWTLYFTRQPVTSLRDVPGTHGSKDDPLHAAYRNHLLRAGIYLHPHYMLRGYLNTAHTSLDVDRILEATDDFFTEGR